MVSVACLNNIRNVANFFQLEYGIFKFLYHSAANVYPAQFTTLDGSPAVGTVLVGHFCKVGTVFQLCIHVFDGSLCFLLLFGCCVLRRNHHYVGDFVATFRRTLVVHFQDVIAVACAERSRNFAGLGVVHNGFEVVNQTENRAVAEVTVILCHRRVL